MRKTGTSSEHPDPEVVRSPTQPMIGRISRPGMTHSDATEKPIDRARGGMASGEDRRGCRARGRRGRR